MRRLNIKFLFTLLLFIGITVAGFGQSSDLYDYDTSTSLDTYEVDYGSTYDWQSGNSYSWSTDASGTTTVDGYNLDTGSTWQTNIESDGDMSGYDSDSNYWEYDKSTGTYYNYGTGETRYHNDTSTETSTYDYDTDLDTSVDWD